MKSIPSHVCVPLLAAVLGSLFVVPSVVSADPARRPARHFELVNATFDSVTALTIAPADGDAYQQVMLGQPLQGGLNTMSFDVPAGGCLRDLRVTFRGGRTQLFPRIDVCQSNGLRLTSHSDRLNP